MSLSFVRSSVIVINVRIISSWDTCPFYQAQMKQWNNLWCTYQAITRPRNRTPRIGHKFLEWKAFRIFSDGVEHIPDQCTRLYWPNAPDVEQYRETSRALLLHFVPRSVKQTEMFIKQVSQLVLLNVIHFHSVTFRVIASLSNSGCKIFFESSPGAKRRN